MQYRNQKHCELFKEEVRKMRKKDNDYVAALYLLTSDARLWNAVKHHTIDSRINLKSIQITHIHPNGYTLFCCAKDFCCGTNHIGVAELSDVDVIPKKVFWVICNAMAIRRFGLAIEQHAIGDGEE